MFHVSTCFWPEVASLACPPYVAWGQWAWVENYCWYWRIQDSQLLPRAHIHALWRCPDLKREKMKTTRLTFDRSMYLLKAIQSLCRQCQYIFTKFQKLINSFTSWKKLPKLEKKYTPPWAAKKLYTHYIFFPIFWPKITCDCPIFLFQSVSTPHPVGRRGWLEKKMGQSDVIFVRGKDRCIFFWNQMWVLIGGTPCIWSLLYSLHVNKWIRCSTFKLSKYKCLKISISDYWWLDLVEIQALKYTPFL